MIKSSVGMLLGAALLLPITPASAGPGGGHHGGGHGGGGHSGGGHSGGGHSGGGFHASGGRPVQFSGGSFHSSGPRVISSGFAPGGGRLATISGRALPNSAFVRSLHVHSGRSRTLFFFGFGSPFGLYGGWLPTYGYPSFAYRSGAYLA